MISSTTFTVSDPGDIPPGKPPVQPPSREADRRERKIRLLIADDHMLILTGLERLLAMEPDIEVVGTATTLKEAVSMTQSLRPDVVLLDVRMPDGSGVDALVDLLAVSGVKVLLLTAGVDEAERAAAFRHGARGIVTKDIHPDQLSDGIRAIARGDYWTGPRPQASQTADSKKPATRRTAPPAYSLTVREREVLKLVGEGCSNREIARQLMISEDTVKHHVSSLFDKTGTSNRVELALFAVRRKLISS
jgi:DNA-binding NarL/FixJ family response regulator